MSRGPRIAVATLLAVAGCQGRKAAPPPADSAAPAPDARAAGTVPAATTSAPTPHPAAAAARVDARPASAAWHPQSPDTGRRRTRDSVPARSPLLRQPPPTPHPVPHLIHPAQSPRSDSTVRGLVEVAGVAARPQFLLRREGSREAVTLVGDTAQLARLAGLDVEVHGAPGAGGEFDVSDVLVRAAQGSPAVDGVLVRDADGFGLRTATGVVHLGNPPMSLRTQLGARVWMTGDLKDSPSRYGVLRPAR